MAKVVKKITSKAIPKKIASKKAGPKKTVAKKMASKAAPRRGPIASEAVLDRLYGVVMDRRTADPAHSHSARLLLRGNAKVAQKFGEEAVECLIECVAGNRPALIAESADVLYHLVVMWVAGGIEPGDVWAELQRREGVSGLLEKAARSGVLAAGTTKIP